MFVMHNPVRFTDPSGLFAIDPSLGIFILPVPDIDDGYWFPWLVPDPLLVEALGNLLYEIGQAAFDLMTWRQRLAFRAMQNINAIIPTRELTFAPPRAISSADVTAAINASLAKAGTHDARGNPYRFFHAFLLTDPRGNILPGVVITTPLTDAAARARIAGIPSDVHTEGVFAITQDAAIWLANQFGGPIPTRLMPEISERGAPGFFWHFHPRYNDAAHIWFI